MAPPMYLGCRTLVPLFCAISLLFVSGCLSDCCSEYQTGRRMLEEASQNEEPPLKNTTKPIKPNLSLKNQTKTIKSNLSSKNQTKLAKVTSDSSSSKTKPTVLNDTVMKKLNSTTKNKKLNSTSKASTKSTSIPSGKTPNLLKEVGAKNKTTKSTAAKEIKPDQKSALESEKTNKNKEKKTAQQKSKKQTPPSWIIDDDENDDFVSDLKDLPTRFQQTIIPDLTKISSTSRIYINKANKEITRGFKPYVGNKYASTVATILSFVFILIPLVLVSLIFNRIKAYFSLQRLLIFIQIYLSIYFFILCFVSLITALEPLRFLYATSQSTYVCLQVIQTLGYVLYLLLLAMYLILVFSTDCGPGSKLVGLTQTFVGFSVGLHYYVTVFHRVVLKQAPKTNWKIHGIYATCFLMSCLIARADRRKKAYMEDGGEEGKKN